MVGERGEEEEEVVEEAGLSEECLGEVFRGR